MSEKKQQIHKNIRRVKKTEKAFVKKKMMKSKQS